MPEPGKVQFLFIRSLLAMNRIASLILRAAQVQRMVWASLPFNVRWAELFKRLATDPSETFGRIIYTAFLKRKVDGLPDINGKPALDFDLNRAPQHLAPPGYGKDFGNLVVGSLLKKYKDYDTLQDVLQDVALTFAMSPERLREGVPLSVARGYVLTVANNAVLVAFRHKKRHPGDYGTGMSDTEDHEAPQVELEDPKALENIFAWIDRETFGKGMEKVMRELAHIPGAVPYVEGVIELGLPDSKLVGREDKGIEPELDWFKEHPMSYGNFSVNLKPKIKKVIQKYIEMLRP